METTCSFVFKDNEFQKEKWREQLVSGSGASRMVVDRISTGGRDGAFRQHIQQWRGDTKGERVTVSHIYMHSLYCPSECGAINSIDFDCGIMNIERSIETHFALLLEQNNILFVSKITLPAKHEKWSTLSLHDLRGADFQRLIPPADERDPFDKQPNFTFLGSHIRFGYATISATNSQDEAVSGIDFWRVTINHQKGEVAHQNVRVLQLEHNTNVLLQELSDMHEHADKTRREHAAHLANLNALQEDVSHERAISAQLRRKMSQQGTALTHAEAEARVARAEAAQLQERIAVMETELRKLALDASEQSGAAMQEVQRLLTEERNRSAILAKTVAVKESELASQHDDIERKKAEIIRLNVEIAASADSQKTLQQTVVELTAENKLLKAEQEKLAELNKTLQQALTDTKASNGRFEELYEMEKKRRRDEERMSAAHDAALKEELRSISMHMEADLANERALRIQMERDHRNELSRIEADTRAERQRMEEQVRAEKLAFMQRETELLEEKRNLATSLQAATTKSALTEQRLSNQLLSVSALHKSEVERIAHLEAELKQERAKSELLESQLPREEEDWEVVDQM